MTSQNGDYQEEEYMKIEDALANASNANELQAKQDAENMKRKVDEKLHEWEQEAGLAIIEKREPIQISDEEFSKVVNSIATLEPVAQASAIKRLGNKNVKKMHHMTATEIKGLVKQIIKSDSARFVGLVENGIGAEFALEHTQIGNGNRPAVLLHDEYGNERNRSDVSKECLKYVVSTNNENPRIFQKDGILIRLRKRKNGWIDVMPATPNVMRGIIAESADFYTRGTEGEVRMVAQPPDYVGNHIVNNLEEELQAFTDLRCIVDHPILIKDKRGKYKVVYEDGFNSESGVYLSTSDLKIDPNISLGDSREQIEEMYSEVSFSKQSQAGLPAAIALLLSPMVRFALDPSETPPFCMAISNVPGAGKTTAQKISLMPMSGRSIRTIRGDVRNIDEFEKRMDTRLLAGDTIVLVDNCYDEIIDALTVLATEQTLGIRIFGTQEEIPVENLLTIAINGVNPKIREDLYQRVYPLWLTATKRASERDYERPSVLKYVEDNRDSILSAVVRIVQEWINQGSKKGKQKHRQRDWASTIGGILNVIPEWGDHFLSDLDLFAKESNEEYLTITRGLKALVLNLFGKPGFGFEDTFSMTDALPTLLYRTGREKDRWLSEEDAGFEPDAIESTDENGKIVYTLPKDQAYWSTLMTGRYPEETVRIRQLGKVFRKKGLGIPFTSVIGDTKYTLCAMEISTSATDSRRYVFEIVDEQSSGNAPTDLQERVAIQNAEEESENIENSNIEGVPF